MNGTAIEAELNQLHQGWRHVPASRPNVLVVGPDAAVADVVEALGGMCRQPLVTRLASMPLALPDPSRTGALILQGVADLPKDGQRRLMAWLDEAGGRTPVVATNPDPVWPGLENGTFLEALYYRLNMVYFDLTGGERDPGATSTEPHAQPRSAGGPPVVTPMAWPSTLADGDVVIASDTTAEPRRFLLHSRAGPQFSCSSYLEAEAWACAYAEETHARVWFTDARGLHLVACLAAREAGEAR